MMKILLASYVLHGEFSFNSAQSYQHRKGEFYIKYDQLVVYFSKIPLIFFFKNVESGKPYLEIDADLHL